MMKISSLEELFAYELRSLYSVEKQIIKALPKMAKMATSSHLQEAIQEHLQQTKKQVERLDQVFDELGQTTGRVKCRAIEAILEEGSETVSMCDEDSVRDACIIDAAQCVEHFEIAIYGTARSHAELLGHKRIQQLLQETLDEEKQADEKLTQLALSEVNVEAVQHA
jgi:ferritin-like metal-binding protein YciE